MANYFNKDLVTLGMLRSPEMPPPPLYNEDDSSAETFQSCALRLFLRVEGVVLNVDMFELEVVENIPLTKVSRGNRVVKKLTIKTKEWLREHQMDQLGTTATPWTKIEFILPTGLQYRYFIQLSAIKSPDISGRQNYRLAVRDISLSPQCMGLGFSQPPAGSGCRAAGVEWRPDLDTRELAQCFEVPYPEQPGVGLDSFLFNSCGTNTGQFGPYKEECVSYYESLGGNTTEVDMLDLATISSLDPDPGPAVPPSCHLGLCLPRPPIGIQKWEAPQSGVFTLIAKGASGGRGRLSSKTSHGAVVRVIVKLERGEQLYFLVGQEGESACVINGVETLEE